MFSIIYPCYYEVKVKSTRIDTFFFEIDIEASGKQFFLHSLLSWQHTIISLISLLYV